jgi:hypothetical protein
MGVMTAGVHDPRILRAVRDVILLGNRKGINIRTERDDLRVLPRPPQDLRDDPPAVRPQIVGDSGGGKTLGDKSCRRMFIPAQLRKCVQVVSHAHDFRLQLDNGQVQPFEMRMK